MKSRILTALLAASSLSATGCFTMNASLPGTLRNDVEESRVEKVGHFEKEVNHMFIPFGIGEAPSTAFREALLAEAKAKGADGVANLRFEAYNSCFDLLIGAATCSVVRPRTFKLSGDLVRIQKAPLPGERPKARDAGETKGPKEQISVELERDEVEVERVLY